MATKPARKPAQDAIPVSRAAILDAFTSLVLSVPEAPEGDIADLLGPIVNATDWEHLNPLDKLPSSKDLVGHSLRVESIRRVVSDKDSLTGFYFLASGNDINTGEVLKFTAGGEQSMAVLAKLHTLGNLPAVVKFTPVSTRSGNDAINCTVEAVIGQGRTLDA